MFLSVSLLYLALIIVSPNQQSIHQVKFYDIFTFTAFTMTIFTIIKVTIINAINATTPYMALTIVSRKQPLFQLYHLDNSITTNIIVTFFIFVIINQVSAALIVLLFAVSGNA